MERKRTLSKDGDLDSKIARFLSIQMNQQMNVGKDERL
jgi:hypothetical protein